MLAVTAHRGYPIVPWNRRMSDVPKASGRARRMLAQNVRPGAIVSYLEAYGYSWYVPHAAVQGAKNALER